MYPFPRTRNSLIKAAAAVILTTASTFAGFSAGFDAPTPFRSVAGDSLTVYGDASVKDGLLDLGQTGLLGLDGFKQPQGPFSVELRVKLKAYGPLVTRYISDFVNTATWGSSTSQGITVRSGGGELYPVLPEEAYSDANGWTASRSYFSNTARASISRCVGEFSIGTGTAYWKEVYTDRCLDLNKWLHIVATWDGEEMRYYVDGHDATDGWRVNAVEAKPVLDATARLHIGASTTSSYDSRHSFAEMDFVTIHDSALSSAQIRGRYRATLELPKQDSVVPTCRRSLRVLSPEAGQAVTSGTPIHVKLEVSPECEDSSVEVRLDPKDSIEVQYSNTPDFSNPHVGKFHDTSAALGKVFGELPSGEVYVRCRLKNDSDSVAHAAAGRVAARAGAVQVSTPWEASRPLVVSQVLGVAKSATARLTTRWNGSELRVASTEMPVVRNLSGRAQSWTAVRIGAQWALRPDAKATGVYVVSAGSAASPIVLP